jgi:LPS sulfotransferase NodH
MTTDGPATIPIRRRRRGRLGIPNFSLTWQRLKHQVHLRRQWWKLPHTPYQPVFVLASHRSGSNLLIDYLNRLPGVGSYNEVLCRVFANGPALFQFGPAPIVRHLRLTLHTLQSPIRGCKLMLDQLVDSHVTLDDLNAAFPTAKYIVLYRQSLAEQFVSKETALATNQWTLSRGDQRKQARVRINPSALREYCERLRKWYGDALAHPWLPERTLIVSYEELVADPRHWICDEICPLLGVPPAEPQSRLLKQSTQPLAQRVENYSEVAALLNGPLCRQRYAWPGRSGMRRAA